MRLIPEDKLVLEELYLHYKIPTDQLKRNQVVLGRIGAAFRRLTGRDDETPEILRYIINRRKNKDWPRLGDQARRFSPALHALEDDELPVLVSVYETIDVPLDEYLLREHLPSELASAFAARTGRVVRASTLVAALIAYRKRGLLVCLRDEKQTKEPQPFSDIDQVVAREQRRA